MSITSIGEAFRRGVHRSIEQVIGRGLSDIAEAFRVAQARFGTEYQLNPVEHALLVGAVQEAVDFGRRMTAGENIPELEFGSITGSYSTYTYTVLATIETGNTVSGERESVTIPWTITTSEILSPSALHAIAMAELLSFRGARYDQSHQNFARQEGPDREFQRERDSYANPEQAIKIDILSVYRS